MVSGAAPLYLVLTACSTRMPWILALKAHLEFASPAGDYWSSPMDFIDRSIVTARIKTISKPSIRCDYALI